VQFADTAVKRPNGRIRNKWLREKEIRRRNRTCHKVKVMFSPLQALEALRVVRG
jgi:hypothetical protein